MPTQTFIIQQPASAVDVAAWVRAMMPWMYETYSRAHLAMDSWQQGGTFQMVNVENIGLETLVHHYELLQASAAHATLHSPRSRAYVLRWWPVTVDVTWDMRVHPVNEAQSHLVCTITVRYPNRLLAAAAFLTGLGGLFLRRHLAEEGAAFALDIERGATTLGAGTAVQPATET